MKDYESNKIICPECNRRVGIYDGKSTIKYEAKCNNCGKIVVYDPETREAETSPIPKRNCGSGMRFY